MKTLRHQFSFSQLHFFFCVILILFVFCGSENAEATTINGDLVVDDNDQTTISSLTYVNGNVTVKDNVINRSNIDLSGVSSGDLDLSGNIVNRSNIDKK